MYVFDIRLLNNNEVKHYEKYSPSYTAMNHWLIIQRLSNRFVVVIETWRQQR